MKEKKKYVCGECGYETVKWMGCCPNCESWNTLVEVTESPKLSVRSTISSNGAHAVSLKNIDESETIRIPTGIGELDRVLGGGVVTVTSPYEAVSLLQDALDSGGTCPLVDEVEPVGRLL